ncbi:MAG TPA: hypothetical protein VKB39_01500 [Candidatus Baltobacteraceae bacterium]|nr:hypothetical protein [Candidatus Baltobacteraceae bacterium]
MIRTRIGKVVAAIVFAVAFMGIGATIAMANQPHMVSARDHLNAALGQLNQAVPDKGGHRNNAISLVNQAIQQVNAGINYAQ